VTFSVDLHSGDQYVTDQRQTQPERLIMTTGITSSHATATRITGAALVGLAIYFNIPYSVLSATFDYPGILRAPTAETLEKFTQGGNSLIAVWYGFAFAALLFIPASLAHAFAGQRLRDAPALAISAGLLGALAGLTQAMGLLRWVMVVPGLAAATEGGAQFAMLHAYAGVAIGEHLGMLLTAAHVAAVALMQAREAQRGLSILGGVTAAGITLGAYEGVALALGLDGTVFSLGAVAGYLLLTVWLAWSGAVLVRRTQ
jgi:hypothetical protein